MRHLPIICLLTLLSAALTVQECSGQTSADFHREAPQLAVARRFIGRPYVAATLEVNAPAESLVVDTLHVDCTTYVDQVLALTFAAEAGEGSDGTFCDWLTRIRYHEGVIDGYASRCHYFTDLVDNMVRQGLLAPVHGRGMTERTITLNFMSTHPDSYVQLKDDPIEQACIRETEQRFRAVRQRYYSKQKAAFFRHTTSPIHDGDVLALVTNVSGLDVSHLGFAVWVDDELHLLNASMRQGSVVLDAQPLRDYLLGRRSCLGIEAWRPLIPATE